MKLCFSLRATSYVWHTGDQARVAQSDYNSGEELHFTGYQVPDDYQLPTDSPDKTCTQPYAVHNITQGAALWADSTMVTGAKMNGCPCVTILFCTWHHWFLEP